MVRDLNKKLLITDGCSWTAGDIVDPEIFGEEVWHVNHPDNDQYRLPKVWPHKLGKLLGIETLNISHAGSSNDGIARRLLNKLPSVLEKYKPEDILVIVGWTSPERKDFYYKPLNDETRAWSTLYPAEIFNNNIEDEDRKKFFKMYVQDYWHSEEYISRYITHNITLHNYFKNNNIDHIFFDAFYESQDAIFDNDKHAVFNSESLCHSIKNLLQEWSEQGNYDKHVEIDGLFKQYEKIYQSNFCNKTFVQHMNKFITPKTLDKYWDDTYHPTELSHTLWADFLYHYVNGKEKFI